MDIRDIIFGIMHGHQDPMENENNPSKFDFAQTIADDECLLLLADMDNIKDRMDKLKRQFALEQALGEVAHRKLFLKLNNLYPHSHTHEGVRKFRGRHHYVGWKCHAEEEDNATGDSKSPH